MIWRGPQTVPGASEAVAALRAAGVPLAFVTNSAARTPAQVAAKLAGHGIPDAEDLVITAAMAAAEMVDPGEPVFAIGSDGLRVALAERGADLVAPDEASTVAVGITADFDYATITDAMRAIRNGARFIATNDDATFPDAGGLLPGNGALVAAVATAAGRAPEVAGKPHAPIVDLTRRALGPTGIMVGDRPETDGVFARELGYDFVLVLTGVTGADDLPVEPEPARVRGSLADCLDGLDADLT